MGDPAPLVSGCGQSGSRRGSSNHGTVSMPSRVAGFASSGTAWNTTFTVAMSLKTTGRVKVNAVGEIWNPFGAETTGGGGGLFGSGVRAGLVIKY